MERFMFFLVFSTFINIDNVLMNNTRTLPFNVTAMFGDKQQFANGSVCIVGVDVLDLESVPEPPPSPRLRTSLPHEPDVNLIREYYRNGLSSSRNLATNATQTRQTMHYLAQVLAQILGKDNVMLQPFKLDIENFALFKYHHGNSMDPGVFSKASNIVGILKGPKYGQTKDTVFVITAHWDSIHNGPGVDDNGSGVVAVLELARLLQAKRKSIPFTVYFVLFDLEEYGLIGSYVFTTSYFAPRVANGSINVIGVYNFDMILNYNSSNNSQDYDMSLMKANPDLVKEIERQGLKGDFVAILARREFDTTLTSSISESFTSIQEQAIKLYSFAAPLPKTGKELDKSQLFWYQLFTATDHYRFWYPVQAKSPNGSWQESTTFADTNFTITAVTFTDLAFMRGYQRLCYHKSCDDASQLTPSNLKFLTTIIKTADRSIDSFAKQYNGDNSGHTEATVPSDNGHTDRDNGDDQQTSDSIRLLPSIQKLLFPIISTASYILLLRKFSSL